MARFQYVDEPKKMWRMILRLRESARLSVDLESDNFHHYGDRIALLQVGDDELVYIVDPQKIDLTPLSKLFADPSREKVFHDVDYDGRMILTFLGVKPAPVFDTMVAARFLGKEKIGLADLLEEYFGIVLDKGFQRADWSHRPLDERMLEYAAHDVAHLLDLRDRMEEELRELGRLEWAREEFRRLVEELSPMPERKPDSTRVKGARDLSPRQLAVLQKLLEWREQEARRRDLPPFKLVGTERLLEVARRNIRNRRDLERSGALSPRQLDRYGRDILKAVESGFRESPERWPRFPTPERQPRDLEVERKIRRLKAARDRRAGELGLDPGFLLPNAALKVLARLKPRTREELDSSGILKRWQLEAVGDALAECLFGRD